MRLFLKKKETFSNGKVTFTKEKQSLMTKKLSRNKTFSNIHSLKEIENIPHGKETFPLEKKLSLKIRDFH